MDDQFVADKTRIVVPTQAGPTDDTPTKYPTFPTGPDATGKVRFLGAFRGARIKGFTWVMSGLTDFTAANATVFTSDDGVVWRTVKAFTEKDADGSETIWLLDTDPGVLRFVCIEITMTGQSGSASHAFHVHYTQHGPRDPLASGVPDRNS